MNIKAIFSYPLESQSEFLKHLKRWRFLPEGMSMKGPFFYFGARDRIKTILIFEFDESRYSEVLETISIQYDDFHTVPGLDFTVLVSKDGFGGKGSGELAWDQIDEKDFSG